MEKQLCSIKAEKKENKLKKHKNIVYGKPGLGFLFVAVSLYSTVEKDKYLHFYYDMTKLQHVINSLWSLKLKLSN
eukprot:snap_masked-scaffold_25-processed-gene-4.21-mRNA-1 protein AED:1.00 eAED:1.00 QI:0/0/0/0/1/1/4/0/74